MTARFPQGEPQKGAVKKCMNNTDITPPPVISTAAKRSGEISLRNVARPRVAGDLSALRFIRAQNLCPIPARSSARGGSAVLCDLTVFNGARAAAQSSCFPLRGNAALAAKGCTRLRVEMKRKGCPDRQTATCLVEYHLRLLPYSTPAPLCGPLRPGGKRVTGTKKERIVSALFPYLLYPGPGQ